MGFSIGDDPIAAGRSTLSSDAKFVLDPPWSPEKMTNDARFLPGIRI
jgi:hypothetical protein